jgi:hypothetical protein
MTAFENLLRRRWQVGNHESNEEEVDGKELLQEFIYVMEEMSAGHELKNEAYKDLQWNDAPAVLTPRSAERSQDVLSPRSENGTAMAMIPLVERKAENKKATEIVRAEAKTRPSCPYCGMTEHTPENVARTQCPTPHAKYIARQAALADVCPEATSESVQVTSNPLTSEREDGSASQPGSEVISGDISIGGRSSPPTSPTSKMNAVKNL